MEVQNVDCQSSEIYGMDVHSLEGMDVQNVDCRRNGTGGKVKGLEGFYRTHTEI